MTAPRHPSFGEAFLYWLRLGFISFGGPAGQIALMHAELVERRRWISEGRFLHALNYCMVLPGPAAQQAAGISSQLLRLSVGIEYGEDLVADLAQAFEQAQQAEQVAK